MWPAAAAMNKARKMAETGTSGKRVGTPPSAWFCGGYGGPGGTYGARLLALSGYNWVIPIRRRGCDCHWRGGSAGTDVTDRILSR
jgi:hypothetical protein